VFQRWLESKGQSQQDLALRAGVPLSVVEAVLSGRSAEVELADLQALAVELDGDVQELMKSDPTDA
jgi:transcriptional regulator with XRE-family HTH domain